jgi:hypothetical protein
MTKYIYNIKKVGKYTVKVVQDDYPLNPRTEYDNLCTMVCFHRRYNLGDKHNFTPESIREYLSENKKTVFWKPLYLYDHSGITISTGPFSCPWDSGQVGYIYIERETFLKEFGFKKMTKKAKERLDSLLTGEVEEYDNYLTGEVYGFMVEDEEENIVDSCWGFIGDQEYCLKEGIDSAEWHVKNDIKKHIGFVKAWIKNHVPLEKRYALTI